MRILTVILELCLYFLLSFTSCTDQITIYIAFHKGDRGQQRATKWESCSAFGGFEYVTLKSKGHDLIRLTTPNQFSVNGLQKRVPVLAKK